MKGICSLTKVIGSFLKKGHAVVVLPTGAVKPMAFNAEAVVQVRPPYSPARAAQHMGRCLRTAKPPAAPQAKRTLKKSGKGKLWTMDEVRLVQLVRSNNRTKQAITKTARAMDRTCNSITAKMSNLDYYDRPKGGKGSKGFKNGGPFDAEVIKEFLTNEKSFAAKANSLARKLGLGTSVTRRPKH